MLNECYGVKFSLCSDIQNILAIGGAVLSAIVGALYTLYTLNPAVVMNYFMYWPIRFVMAYISTSAAIEVLSFLNFGRYLANMILFHDDDPGTCAESCK